MLMHNTVMHISENMLANTSSAGIVRGKWEAPALVEQSGYSMTAYTEGSKMKGSWQDKEELEGHA